MESTEFIIHNQAEGYTEEKPPEYLTLILREVMYNNIKERENAEVKLFRSAILGHTNRKIYFGINPSTRWISE